MTYPKEIMRSKVMKRIFDLLAKKPQGMTALEIAYRLRASPHFVKKCVSKMFGWNILIVVGYGSNYAHSINVPRLYTLSLRYGHEALPVKRVASVADEASRANLIQAAKGHGVFGVLVAQAIGD